MLDVQIIEIIINHMKSCLREGVNVDVAWQIRLLVSPSRSSLNISLGRAGAYFCIGGGLHHGLGLWLMLVKNVYE